MQAAAGVADHEPINFDGINGPAKHSVNSGARQIAAGSLTPASEAKEVLCCAVLCCAVLCCAVLCWAVLCCAVLCCACQAALHALCTVQHRARGASN